MGHRYCPELIWPQISRHPSTTNLAEKSSYFLNLTRSKYWVWALLSVPFVFICVRFASDAISYGQVIHQTGLWSAGLLVVALAITPLRKVLKSVNSIASHRRALGVASFAYAALHTGVYLDRKWGADLILREGLEPSLATGWLAFAIFVLLAVTSNDRSVRSLGRAWKRLHRWVYAATILMFVHWWLASFDPTIGYILAAILVVIQLLRRQQTSSVS
jgi:sulfoxide reductase heme-binding subunit YedZ